jgi:hypothetical protein
MLVAYDQYLMNWHQTQVSALESAAASGAASGAASASGHRQVSIYTTIYTLVSINNICNLRTLPKSLCMYIYSLLRNPTIRILVAYDQCPMNGHQKQVLAPASAVAWGTASAPGHHQGSIYM